MFETLYKTDSPTELEHAEYYQPNLDMEFVEGKWIFFVREKHGWFNDARKRAEHHITTLSPDEPYTDAKEAQARYDQQLRHRASEGFVHSFSFDPFAPNGVHYRRVNLN